MCGIFGYVGPTSPKASRGKPSANAAEIVFEGLKRLEYRGYDSWGIVAKATSNKQHVTGNKLFIEKHVGKIGTSKLNSKLLTLNSNIALGHTRWATHGGVTVANAHPHLDCSGKIAVVHNGIAENYLDLKKSLSKKHKFTSETDTEVIVHLVEEYAKKNPLHIAIQKAFKRLSGLNAIVVVAGDEMVAAKNGSPLVVGLGKAENFIASDAAALLPHTKRVIFVKDNQLVKISPKTVDVLDLLSGRKIKPQVETLNWQVEEVELGKFKHYMLKEIYEQPQIVRNIAENYLNQVNQLVSLIISAKGTFLIGAGTAFHACLFGSYLFSKLAKQHVNTIVASEFNYLEDFLGKNSLVIALSQSGETIDVIEPLKIAKEKGATVVGIVNNLGSTIWQMSDYKILLGAGPEIAVASTKAYIAKLAMLLLVVYGLTGKFGEGRKLLSMAADEVERILFEQTDEFKKIAKVLVRHDHIFTIGRGLSYQSALEAALKMKEVSYVHTEGLAGGELKHGPIALISKGTPCIVFAPQDETYEAIISNATEIKSRGGYIIGISPKNHQVFDQWLEVRDCGVASIIPNVIPCQLFGYYLATEKGLDPDKPRNLAKSVTVT